MLTMSMAPAFADGTNPISSGGSGASDCSNVGIPLVACVTASETLTPGSLHFNAVSDILFPGAAISGSNQDAITTPGPTNGFVDLTDATGSNAGWNVSVIAPTLALETPAYIAWAAGSRTASAPTPQYLTGAENVLPYANFDSSSVPSCDIGSTCGKFQTTVNSNALPLGPVGVVVADAAALTGAGSQNFSLGFDQPIPALNNAGSYSATWTFTLASGPTGPAGNGTTKVGPGDDGTYGTFTPGP